MIAFSHVSEKILNLDKEVPRRQLDDYKLALSELEKFGFDVRHPLLDKALDEQANGLVEQEKDCQINENLSKSQRWPRVSTPNYHYEVQKQEKPLLFERTMINLSYVLSVWNLKTIDAPWFSFNALLQSVIPLCSLIFLLILEINGL